MKTADRASLAAVRDAARAAIDRGVGGRWALPGDGLLELERPTGFLVVGREDDRGTMRRLTGGMAARLVLPAERRLDAGVGAVLDAVVEASRDRRPASSPLRLVALRVEPVDEPACVGRVVIAPGSERDELARAAREALDGLEVHGAPWTLRLRRERPRGVALGDGVPDPAPSLGWIDVVLAPIFRSDGPRGEVEHPLVLEDVRRALHRALIPLVEGAPATRADPLGTGRLDAAARRADAMLCAAAGAFEVLVQLTPDDLEGVWHRLVETDFGEEPRLRYRPLDHDPVAIKRAVFAAPVDAIEDPFVAELLRDKQEELDRTLSMLRDRGETFLHESEQVFGAPDPELVALAEAILALEPPARDDDEGDGLLDTAALVERAREHLLAYRDQDPLFPDELEVRGEIVAGMMVSRGRLLIRRGYAASEARLAALLEHEIGTHVVTWFNGSAQPLGVLGCGLPGYEALQEGLAVLAEHLAGHLDPSRMRTFAARVLAAESVVDGASFLEVFHRLRRDAGLSKRAAFQITVRAQRGGGLTKDLAYLRGLVEVVEHVRTGGELEPLYLGKIALRHLPLVEMLLARGAIGPPRVLPRLLRDRDARARLARLRSAERATDVILRMAGGEA